MDEVGANIDIRTDRLIQSTLRSANGLFAEATVITIAHHTPPQEVIDWAHIVSTCGADVGTQTSLDGSKVRPRFVPLAAPHTVQEQVTANNALSPNRPHRQSRADQWHPATKTAEKLVRRSAPVYASESTTPPYISTSTPLPAALPPGCTAAWNRSIGVLVLDDDDDSTSQMLSWGRAVHCSHAGIAAIPQPLPSGAQYLYSVEEIIRVSRLLGTLATTISPQFLQMFLRACSHPS